MTIFALFSMIFSNILKIFKEGKKDFFGLERPFPQVHSEHNKSAIFSFLQKIILVRVRMMRDLNEDEKCSGCSLWEKNLSLKYDLRSVWFLCKEVVSVR